MTTATTATLTPLSSGPILTKHQQGVHIIFASPELEQQVGPDPDEAQREAGAGALTAASPIPIAVTDIIVLAGQPWHMVNGRLEKHPDVHTSFRQTVLKLLPERGETAVWWSEERFDITGIAPEPHVQNPTTLQRPFDPPRTEPGADQTGRTIHVAKSAVPSNGSQNHEFKITFTGNGIPIDPNMRCL